MDKSKWEYKKLGEVCEVLDKLRRPVTKSDRVTGQYPYYGATGIQDYVADYIFDGRYLLLGEDGAKWGANDKSAFIIEGKTWVNNHAHILKISEDYLDVFVMYYLNHKDLSEYITGAVVPKLTQAAMTKIPIPAVSVADQQRIVAELDCLNEMIALKQEQLKEFDKLALSIFYDMFGDPVANDKDWESSSFGDCIKLRSGDGLSAKDIVSGDYPVYGGNGIVGYHNEFNLDEDAIIIGRVGALCGNVRNVRGRIFVTDNAFILSQLKVFDNVFLKHLLEILNLRKFAREAMQPVISNKTLKDVKIPLPPLALQQQFAEKIQAIEEQKELAKQSIAETQQLLDSRMDYYFD